MMGVIEGATAMRDRLIALLDKAFIKSDDNFGMPNVNQVADYLIANGVILPPADVVEVVRCRNCAYWDEEGRCKGIQNGLILDYTTGVDYCSYGERKTENE